MFLLLSHSSPQKGRNQSRRNREDDLGAVSCLLRQKHHIFWRDIMPVLLGESGGLYHLCATRKVPRVGFFPMLQKAWSCFAQARFIRCALLISRTHTHTQTQLSPVSLLCKLTLKRVLWSQAQAGQSLSSQQGAAQTIQAEKSAPQTTGIWLFFLFKFCVLST